MKWQPKRTCVHVWHNWPRHLLYFYPWVLAEMIQSIQGLIASLRGDRSTAGLSPTNHQRRDPVLYWLCQNTTCWMSSTVANTFCIVSTALSPSHTLSHFIHMFKGYTDPSGHTGSCVFLSKVTDNESAWGLQHYPHSHIPKDSQHMRNS